LGKVVEALVYQSEKLTRWLMVKINVFNKCKKEQAQGPDPMVQLSIMTWPNQKRKKHPSNKGDDRWQRELARKRCVGWRIARWSASLLPHGNRNPPVHPPPIQKGHCISLQLPKPGQRRPQYLIAMTKTSREQAIANIAMTKNN